jgi:uncharacterized damage-inducible protein DinB
MSQLDSLVNQAQFIGNNVAYNLEFIPVEKLNWKPAPTAKSALEVVNHVVGALEAMRPVLGGGSWTAPQFTPATDLRSAQALLRRTANDYAEALKKVSPADLERKIELPFGTFPLGQCCAFPVVDLGHHHGQIAYIQTLLGDTEDHFDRPGR